MALDNEFVFRATFLLYILQEFIKWRPSVLLCASVCMLKYSVKGSAKELSEACKEFTVV